MILTLDCLSIHLDIIKIGWPQSHLIIRTYMYTLGLLCLQTNVIWLICSVLHKIVLHILKVFDGRFRTEISFAVLLDVVDLSVHLT